MATALRLHREGVVTRLELAHPAGYPRLSGSLLADLSFALDRSLADPACHGLVIHGSTPLTTGGAPACFAAGAEVAEVGALTGATALDFSRRAQLLFQRLATAPKPIVAAVSGYCLGGGFDLALACHHRLATPDAVFGHPGATLGLLTGWGGTQRLPRLLGRSRALEMLLLGESMGAARALEVGLVEAVVPVDALLPAACHRAAQEASAEIS